MRLSGGRCKRKRYAYGSRTVPELRCKVAGRVEYRGDEPLGSKGDWIAGCRTTGTPYVIVKTHPPLFFTLCVRAQRGVARAPPPRPRGTICNKRQTGCYSRLSPWSCSLPPLQYFHSLLNLFHTLASSDLLPVRHRPTHPSMVSASSAVATESVPAAPMQHDTHRSNSRQQVPCSACSSQPSQLKRPRCAAPQQPSGSSCSR